MLRTSCAALLGIVLVVGLAAAGCSTFRANPAPPHTPTAGMIGEGGTTGMTGMMGGPIQTVTPTEVRNFSRQSEADATIDHTTKTIAFRSPHVRIIALASPEGGPDMTWNIDGLVNPTLIIPRGATVTVQFINADPDTPHGWELTTAAPPYPLMPMMDETVAFPGALATPLSGATAERWPRRTVSFTAVARGTYYYLCPVPSHAQQGMIGRLIVA